MHIHHKGEIPLDKRNVDNYPVLKKARFYKGKNEDGNNIVIKFQNK